MSALLDAIERLKSEPEKLTGADVALITKADPALGERARAARSKAEGERLADAVAPVVKQALASRDAKIAALEQRVLELEAQAASREEVTP